MTKALTELIRDANREITPADRHAILDLIEQQAEQIAKLEGDVNALRWELRDARKTVQPVAPAVDALTDGRIIDIAYE